MVLTPYHEISEGLFESFKNIRLVVSDVDGVLSDGKIYLTENGDEIKSFNAKDGCGIVALRKIDIPFAVITGRKSALLERRLSSLNVEHIYQGVKDKVEVFYKLIHKLGLKEENAIYIGDDVIDIPLLKIVGVAVAVKDAHPFVHKVADIVTSNVGGNGAVREITDILLQAHGKLDSYEVSI